MVGSCEYMLFTLYKILFTELITVITLAVPYMVFIVLSLVEHLPGVLLGILVLEMGLKGVVLERVLRREVFVIDGSMRRLRFHEFSDFLLEIYGFLVYGSDF